MRKLAPAFVLTSILALSSAAALADPTTNSSTPTPQAADAPSSTMGGQADTSPSMNGTKDINKSDGSQNGTTMANTYDNSATPGAKRTKAKKMAKDDGRCDESKYAVGTMPKDCAPNGGTGAAGSTEGQSRGK